MTLINCHVIGAELTVELGIGTGSSVCFSVCLFCRFIIIVDVIACQILALWLVLPGSRSGTHTRTHIHTLAYLITAKTKPTIVYNYPHLLAICRRCCCCCCYYCWCCN